MTIYDFQARTIDGKECLFSDFREKVLLIVNVASRCSFTTQYQGLEFLYKKYNESGFLILGFPCNQFGGQEPARESEIKSFCETKFGVTFPLFEKIEVKGAQAHPLYQFLTKSKPGLLGTKGIKWNFTKFLIDRRGNTVKRYAPINRPETMEEEIKGLLTA
jgi:glutathione peroxidase